MVDTTELNAAQDQVFRNKTLWPRTMQGREITFCNLAALDVANAIGCHDFDAPEGHEPLLADQIYEVFSKSGKFKAKLMDECQSLVNSGALIFAVLPSFKLGHEAGHICSLTTGDGDFSGHWARHTPLVMNLGREGTCFRRKGVNYAFQIPPEFYAWEPSL